MTLLFRIITLGIFYMPSYQCLLSHVNNANQLQSCFTAHYVYQKDVAETDEWQQPEVFCRTWRGDCGDTAGLCYGVLRQKGYDCILYIVGGREHKTDHAVCWFRRGNDYGIFTNGKIEKYTLSEYMMIHNFDYWDIATINSYE